MFTNTPSFTSLSQSHASLKIEQVVEAISRSKQPAFRIHRSHRTDEYVEPTQIGALLFDINSLLNVYADHYDYSEHLEAFFQACQDIRLERCFQGATCLDETGRYYLSFHHTMNRLVARIRELTQTLAFQRRANDKRYQSKQNNVQIERYVQSVLQKCSRTEVLRINLYYLDVVLPRLQIEHVYKDLDALIRARERNPIFAYETGYAWALEQGGKTGSFHIHAAFFFNGAHVNHDWGKGKQIEALWKQLTQGWGYAHICDSREGSYKDRGIGTIHRNNSLACGNTAKAVRYLTKDDQHLRVKPHGRRTFGMGQL